MKVRVRDLLAEELGFRLEVLNRGANLDTELQKKEINRPGLALSGFIDHFAFERLQVFGNGEWAFLQSLSPDKLQQALIRYFNFQVPCLVYTHSHKPPEPLLNAADEKGVPVLRTPMNTNQFIQHYTDFMDRILAQRTTIHGVLVEVFGVGVLITGKSGVGKSEAALELIERGHRLVADDSVEIVRLGASRLYGYVSDVIEHNMEIRGLGIINIKDLYGAGSVRRSKRIDLVVNLEYWQEGKEYDRLGLYDQTHEILAVPVSSYTLPVKPGRNIPILMETAAKNHRLKQMGVHAARDFSEKLRNRTSRKEE